MPVNVASADDLRGVIEHLQQHEERIASTEVCLESIRCILETLTQRLRDHDSALASLDQRVTALEQGSGGGQPPQPGTITINSLPLTPGPAEARVA